MKTRTLSLLAAGGTCMIAGGQASAQLTGVSVASKSNEFGILTCNVYAEFDKPPAFFLGVGGNLIDSTYTVIDGTFFQSVFGSDRPSNPALFPVFPTLRYDTFVTLAVKSFNPNSPGVPEGQPMEQMQFSPGWPGFGASSMVLPNAAYALVSSMPQADPFNPDYVRGDGGYLIGQFSTTDGTGFTGDLQINFYSDVPGGTQEAQLVSFVHTVDKACFKVVTEQTMCHTNGAAFTFAVDGVENCSGSQFSFNFTGSGGAVGEQLCFSVVVNDGEGQECCAVELCTTIPDCGLQTLSPYDLDADGVVGISDMLELLAVWGPCGGCTVPLICPADFDGDCSVGILDLLVLLGNWTA